VSLEKSFGSKSLNNLLSRFGFSIIAEEILRKQSAAKINRTKHQQVDNLYICILYMYVYYIRWVICSMD
jgi:hypothetical protein